VATGTPEELVRRAERTYTGQFLRPLITGS